MLRLLLVGCRAKGAFHTPAFRTMQERCIVQELSWEKPAKKWEAVLEELAAAPSKPTTQPPSKAARDSTFARAGSFSTPVQQVNREGDAVPFGAVQRKAAETPVRVPPCACQLQKTWTSESAMQWVRKTASQHVNVCKCEGEGA